MWHTHMLTSIAGYNTDCKLLMGSTLHHDDSLNDRTAGAILDRSYQSTKKLWFKEFGEDYVVEGGMYRGEPPNNYFSMEWKGDEFSPTIEVIREMGASSTSPNIVAPPKRWAPVSGTSSDGSPAFIAPSKAGNRNALKGEAHKENYVLGKVNNKVGYYHVETKEAYHIMLSRLKSRIRRLESQIAMEKGCCGQKRVTVINQKELELKNLNDVYTEMDNRSKGHQTQRSDLKRPRQPF